MTDVTAHESGRAGRPLNPANRRLRLRQHYIKAIGGIEKLTPALVEHIRTAVELTCLAAELRAKITKAGAASSEDILAVVRLENAASRAVARLGLPAPTTINTVAA